MITIPPSALSGSPTPSSPMAQPPSPENLLMAAATMHQLGRLKPAAKPKPAEGSR